jgi:DNA-binding beta-propeller fold protein YncE
VGSGEVVGAAALSSDGSSGFVAEVSSQQIYRIDNIAATPVFTALLDSSSPAGNPVDMVLSSDDQRLFVADSARISIRVLDARSGAQTAELPLDFAPSSFTRVSPDVYLVNYSGTAEGSLYLLDTGTSPRISFVPKGRLD